MKILIEMTEKEYDEYRGYLEQKEVYVVDTDFKKLKEEEVTQALIDIVKNADLLKELQKPSKKMDDVKNGVFTRAITCGKWNNIKERKDNANN